MTRSSAQRFLVVEGDRVNIFNDLAHHEVMGAVWHSAWSPDFIQKAHWTVRQEAPFVQWAREKGEWSAVRLSRIPYERKNGSVLTHPEYRQAKRLLQRVASQLSLAGPLIDHSRVEAAWSDPGNAAIHPDAVQLTMTTVSVGVPTEYIAVPVRGKMMPGVFHGFYEFHPHNRTEVEAQSTPLKSDAILIMKGVRFPYRRVTETKGLLHYRPDRKIVEAGKHRLLIQHSI